MYKDEQLNEAWWEREEDRDRSVIIKRANQINSLQDGYLERIDI